MVKKNKNSPLTKLKSQITHPKLVIGLLIPLLLFAAIFSYSKYKDWDNAQLIKGLAKDFPILVSEIEQATGLDLEQSVDCMITTEKFSKGVRTCELSAGYVGLEEAEYRLNQIFLDQNLFVKTDNEREMSGFNATYREKKSCSIWFADVERFNVACITAVREANIDLARELFLK